MTRPQKTKSEHSDTFQNKRIGIFAGSFDPIHDGHLAVAVSAIKNLELDKVLIMVEKNPWSSKQPISIDYRVKMVELAVENTDKLEQLKVGDNRFDLENTLPQIENIYLSSELYFIFGADVFMQINEDKWPGLERLFKHSIVVFERSKITDTEITNHANSLGVDVVILESKFPNYSSTDVRLQTHNKSIWVPEKVAKFIDDNNLY